MRTYLFVALIAAIVTYMTVPLARLASFRLKATKPPGERDVHKGPMPRLGGLAMLAGATAAVFAAQRAPFLSGVFTIDNRVWVIFAAATVMCLLGALDDIKALFWAHRLAIQLLVGWFLASQGVSLLTLPIGGVVVGSYAMSMAVTILLFVVVVNAVNFIDGLDGLAAGVVLISAGAFFLFTYQLTRGTNPENYSSLATLVTAVLIGLCVGFLPHNSHPARIFMGDSGAYLLGTLLVTATITVTGQVNPSDFQGEADNLALLPMLVPLACLFVPLADFAGAVIRRIARGSSPFKPDGQHFHHLLMKLGHTHRRAVLVMYLWTTFIAGGTVTIGVLEPRAWATVLVVGFGLCVIMTFGAIPNFVLPKRLARLTAVEEDTPDPAEVPGGLTVAVPTDAPAPRGAQVAPPASQQQSPPTPPRHSAD
ncbi:undecaprenyl/decaprenyl-phosphate alpha-N-acetylglucosaminyl 1-phosphate transferase [Micrococcales bacterium 31B]|nr:undecaprenyl/decaprenyl-phosphate alpha-N-acetylglucosaminyl 1-phosphate transferase [Micrococcales bacterium 31B]